MTNKGKIKGKKTMKRKEGLLPDALNLKGLRMSALSLEGHCS
jgi:hypothetical protein